MSRKRKSPQLKFKNQRLFKKYLNRYEALPSYKKVLSTMIRFKHMYRPIGKPGYPDPLGHMRWENEWRRYQRAQILLHKKDLVETFDETRGKRLVVTSRGHKIFYEDYPLAKLRDKPWDGIWTVVMYDFPEARRKDRRFIRRRLMDLGFGSPQISILISPLPIEGPIQELLEGEKVAEQVWTLRAERILGMENREVVKKAWPIIDELNTLYDELLDVLPRARKNKKLKEQWRRYFLAVNSADPYLPLELLPKDWKGKKCERKFVRLGSLGFIKVLLRGLV